MPTQRRRTVLATASAVTLVGSVLGIGSGVFAASQPYYYDISHLTPLARRAIETLGADGVMNGTAPGKFAPYGTVTRAQAIKFVVKALHLKKAYPSHASFPDISRFSQYYPYVEAALSGGYLNGLWAAGQELGPSVPMSRVDFAVLATNALHDQALATKLASSTRYSYLRDLSQVPTADRGDVNAMMQVGIIPPINTHIYGPFSRLNREEFAVAMFRMYNVLTHASTPSKPSSASVPSTVSLNASASSVATGKADILSTVVENRQGQPLTSSQLAGYKVRYAVTSANASQAVVSPNGTFVATGSGTYTVTVTVSGPGLTAPLTATTTVTVFGAATSLGITLASPTVVADEAALDTVTVKVFDRAGNLVPDFSGAVTLTDTGHATGIVGSNGKTSDGPVTANAKNGVATFTVQSTGSAVGASDTLSATATVNGQALPAAQATLETVAQKATKVSVTAKNPYLTSNQSGSTDQVQAVVLDQAGQPMLTGTYPIQFSVSGPATFSGGSTAPVSTAFVANGTTSPTPAEAELASVQGQSGTVTVTATSTGLTTGTATVTAAIAGVPAKLGVSAAHSSVTAGQSDPLTVTLEDANGVPVKAPATLTLTGTVSGASALSGTIAQGSTSGQLTFKDTKAGTYTVAVSGTYPSTSGTPVNLTAGSVSVTVSAGSPTAVAISPAGPTPGSALDVPYAAQEQVPVTVSLTDQYGNPVAEPGVSITLKASASQSQSSVNMNGVTGTQTTLTTDSQGHAHATVAFVSNPGTVWTLKAEGSNLTTAKQTFQVVSAVASQVKVALKDASTGSAAEATAGDTVDGTISTVGSNGLPVANGDEILVTVSPAGGFAQDTQGATVLTFPSGVTASLVPGSQTSYLVKTQGSGTVSFTAKAALAGEVTVTAKDVSLLSPVTGSGSIQVIASSQLGGAALFGSSGQNLARTPLTVSANSPAAITLRLTDAEGNPIVSSTSQTVKLSAVTTGSNGAPTTTSAGGAFRTSAEGADLTSSEVTVPPGTASVTLYYVNPTAGSYFLDGSLVSGS